MNVKSRISEKYSETQRQIIQYLLDGMKRGKHYFKSKYIAKDLGLSSKEVGTNLRILVETCRELRIIPWSYSNSTTWMVEPNIT